MKRKGFTLVELVIVIVIVGILSIVAVPIYRGYTRKAMATEAKSLLGSIQIAEKVYYAANSVYFTTAATAYAEDLDVDARANKYFKTFTISSTDTSGFTASTAGETGGAAANISITLKGLTNGSPEWVESGLQ
ncbi:MAG: prepilin-type N-terminal cleavage/methylation domain-containing protein [Elusimicrobia bacterium]|nr:prepilin-type N-terminal cleavage/methylation domain-containing protein [Elusimicrobiota bacterium]